MSEGRTGRLGVGGWRGRTVRRSVLGLSLVGALIGGSAAVVNATAAPVGLGAGGCYDPVTYRARPDDGVLDREPIQAAIDDAIAAGGGTVCLGSGHWTLNRAPAGTYNRFAALSTHGAHLTIVGTGPGTVLDLVGDQGAGATSVISLDPGASDISIERLTIDTSAATNTDEQTHAISIGSGVCTPLNGTCSMPVSDVTVRDVRFVHPPLPGFRKGDCIRLAGNTTATPVKRATIIGSSFVNCARSGIAVQRNVISLAVIGNHFAEQIGDTPFDGEATGGGFDDGLRLADNSFADAPATFSAALTSYRHATITGNTFTGRGLILYRTQDAVVTGNTFDVTAISAEGVVEVGNVASGAKIDGNVIRRHGAPGPAIRITPHSGGIPRQVSVTDNTIVVDGNSTGIYSEAASDIGIRDNGITFADPAPAGSGISLRATIAAMDGLTITGNSIAGPLSADGSSTYLSAIRLSANPQQMHGVTVALNASRGAIQSLLCEQTVAGNFPDGIVSLGNRWNSTPRCPGVTLQAGQ